MKKIYCYIATLLCACLLCACGDGSHNIPAQEVVVTSEEVKEQTDEVNGIAEEKAYDAGQIRLVKTEYLALDKETYETAYIIEEVTYTYGLDGELKNSKSIYDNGSLKTTIYWNNLPVKETYINSEGETREYIYEYSYKESSVECKEFNENGEVVGEEIREYDDSGNLVECVKNRTNWLHPEHKTYEYDDGRLIGWHDLSDGGDLPYTIEYENGKKQREVLWFLNKTRYYCTDFIYDKNGLLVEEWMHFQEEHAPSFAKIWYEYCDTGDCLVVKKFTLCDAEYIWAELYYYEY